MVAERLDVEESRAALSEPREDADGLYERGPREFVVGPPALR